MCGIGGIVSLSTGEIPYLKASLEAMNELQRHRGPDGCGMWTHSEGIIGFAHRRLSIIDLKTGQQPMRDNAGNWVTYNGEIYNYMELRREIGEENFATCSDTEVILQAYRKWKADCVLRFRGMFAFALWDDGNQSLFCARDRFGIKPFYYTVLDGIFYFASEIKALLPFVPEIDSDVEGLKDYLTFQFCLAGKTLFNGIHELLPGHVLEIHNGTIRTQRYWEVYYHPDFDHTDHYFEEKIRSMLKESVAFHLRSDVPVGAYLSGGIDSSSIASIAAEYQNSDFKAFTGKFSKHDGYDESYYARVLAQKCGFQLHEVNIQQEDFVKYIQDVVYHLDFPVAGPGSFPQFMVSKLAGSFRKVVLGGQGGDEIFGGYVRYIIAYFEQCIKAAIDGAMHTGNFIVTYESIIPNLVALRNYKVLLQEFWQEDLFDDMDKRYFRLVNRSKDLKGEINWTLLGNYSPYETFRNIFHGDNVEKESYFDSMTHFDFKTLLPALLQVEDRMSMAHGLESRVPFLDHPLVELAATIPSNIKFKNGAMKHALKNAMRVDLPESIVNRTDKMGFPVPLQEWINEKGVVWEFIHDVLSTQNALTRPLVDNRKVLASLSKEKKFGRKLWGLLCLELWHQTFHDRPTHFKEYLKKGALT